MKKWLWFVLFPALAHATVTSQNFTATFTCTNITGPYPFTFAITDPSSMTVTQNGAVVNPGLYTIVPVNKSYTNGGTITFKTPCPAGQIVVLHRITPITQQTVFQNNQPIPALSVMSGLDKLTMIDQEMSAFWQGVTCPVGQVVQQFKPLICVPNGGNPNGPYVSIPQATSQTMVGPLVNAGLNGIPNAASFTGADSSVQINNCLKAAAVNGTNICDARAITGTQYMATNMASGINQPAQLLLSPNVIFLVSATQVLTSGFNIQGVSSGPSGIFSAVPDFLWVGAANGKMFDFKDAPNARITGVLIDCNSNGTYTAGTGIGFSGGIVPTFYANLRDVNVQNCSGTPGIGIDNQTPATYSVAMTNAAGSLTGTLLSGSFPLNWVGQSTYSFVVQSASNSSFNTPVPPAGAFPAFLITITSTSTFTATVPQTSQGYTWSPATASGVTGNLVSFSELQDAFFDNVFINSNKIGFTTASAGAKFRGGGIGPNTQYGIELFNNGAASLSDQVIFTGNGYDLYIAGSGPSVYSNGTWFENSVNGMIGAASSVSGYTLNFTNSAIESTNASNWMNISAAGAGTLNFVDSCLNVLSLSTTATGNSSATINSFGWSTSSVCSQPVFSGFGIAGTTPLVGAPPANQAVCVKNIGPPLLLGQCTSVVSSSGGCTCT